jgi:ketosteroid isomerase-like protein
MAKKKKKDKKEKKLKKGKKAKSQKVKAPKKKADKSSKKKDGVRAVAKRIVDLTTSDPGDAIFDIYAEDVESIEMNQPATVGLDAIRAKFEGWNSMVSNPQFTAKNIWVDGDTIIIEWVGDVTLNANGKQATLREIAVHEIKGGKIKRERYYYDPQALQPS